MIVEPKVREFICTTAHPLGCAESVRRQIEYVKGQGKIEGAGRVLVIGCSTGYGLHPGLRLRLAAELPRWVSC